MVLEKTAEVKFQVLTVAVTAGRVVGKQKVYYMKLMLLEKTAVVKFVVVTVVVAVKRLLVMQKAY